MIDPQTLGVMAGGLRCRRGNIIIPAFALGRTQELLHLLLDLFKAGAIIISASGVCDAGRIKHHLRHHLGRPQCAIVTIGFRTEGTLGRRLVDGDRHVRIFGEEIRVRASIHTIGDLSAHADQTALLNWLKCFEAAPQRSFVVHSEARTACGFADRVADEPGWSVEVPAPGTRVDL